jgi:hypothetical protein
MFKKLDRFTVIMGTVTILAILAWGYSTYYLLTTIEKHGLKKITEGLWYGEEGKPK